MNNSSFNNHEDQHSPNSKLNPSISHRKRRKKARVRRIILSILAFFVAVGLFSYFVIGTASDIFGMGKEDRAIDIQIESGMSSSSVAKLLQDEGIINQSISYRLYSFIKKNDGIIQAGDYVLNSNMSYDQIMIALSNGNVIKEEVRITFIEGETASEIANKLEKNGVCKADEFLTAIDNETYGFEFENMLSDNEFRFRALEGYLFPDTYDFYKGENIDSVVKKFLRNFDKKVFPELYQEILDAGMTLDDAIILASVIQKEASVAEEMYHVSSVFHNRMNNESAGLPRLQSDVTIIYVEEDIKTYQKMATQDMYDAYNTYKAEGLPVGPICSPGLEAIKAAINPDETNDYYFVTDINGKFYYSKTLDEHDRNVVLAKSVG